LAEYYLLGVNIMKKVLALLISMVLFVLCISGCADNGTENKNLNLKNEYVEVQDNQYMYFDNWHGTPIQHSENGYYYMKNKFLFFIDEESFETYPLCNKSDCLHDKETDETKKEDCNAFVNIYEDQPKIQYYDGNIYTMFVDENDNYSLSLRKFDVKTQTKEDVFKLDTKDVDDWIIHRGYMYYIDSVLTNIDENGNETTDNDTALYRVDLLSNNHKAEKISNFDELGVSLQQASNMQAYGNYIYYDTQTVKRGTDILDADNDTFDDKRYCYDIENNKNFCITDNLKGDDPYYCGFYNDKIIYISGKFRVFTCDLDGKNTTTLFKYDKKFYGYNIFTDGKYIYFVNYSTGADNYTVFDENGKQLNEVKMPFAVDPIVPFDSNYIIYCEDGNTELQVVDKSKIATASKLTAKTIYTFVDNTISQ
jgi:hypothetical protein